MSYYTNQLINLIQCPMFHDAIQADLERGYRLYEINAATAEGSHVWFQALSPKHFIDYLDEFKSMAQEFYFDKYRCHADETLAITVSEIDLDECNTANLYRMD